MSISVGDRRFWVKIIAGKEQGMSKTIYYRNDLPFQVMNKWRWYFRYREALYRVQNPRHYVELSSGSYDYVAPIDEQRKELRNKIKGAKAVVTKYENLLKKAKESWQELFPIEDEEDYKKSVLKINKKKHEVRLYEYELSQLNFNPCAVS